VGCASSGSPPRRGRSSSSGSQFQRPPADANSVYRYVEDGNKVTERIGLLARPPDVYVTDGTKRVHSSRSGGRCGDVGEHGAPYRGLPTVLPYCPAWTATRRYYSHEGRQIGTTTSRTSAVYVKGLARFRDRRGRSKTGGQALGLGTTHTWKLKHKRGGSAGGPEDRNVRGALQTGEVFVLSTRECQARPREGRAGLLRRFQGESPRRGRH